MENIDEEFRCSQRQGWFRCNGSMSFCISPGQVCDGHPDCQDSSDESEQVCERWQCQDGVRCSTGGICIRTPHRVMCQPQVTPVCPDNSDQKQCHHTLYSGCFLSTKMGLTISTCDTCLCQLRKENHSKIGEVYRSTGTTFR